MKIKKAAASVILLLFTAVLSTAVYARSESASLSVDAGAVSYGQRVGVSLQVSGLSGALECYGPVIIRYNNSLFSFDLDGTRSSVEGNSLDKGMVSVEDFGSYIKVDAPNSKPNGPQLFTAYFVAKSTTGRAEFSITAGDVEGLSYTATFPAPVVVGIGSGTVSVYVAAPTPTPTLPPTPTPGPTATPTPSPTPTVSPTPAPPITLKDKAGKAYTVIAVYDETVTPPEGFGEAEALLIAGQPVPNWVSSDGKTVLIRAKDSGGKVGFFSYDAVLKLIKSYSAPVRFSVSGRDLLIVMDPDLAGEIPKGFTETTAKVGGQDVLAWKYETAEPGTGLFGVYLLCLEDSTGRTAFYLFDEKTSDIMSFDTLQDHGLLVTSATTATLPSVTPQATPTPTPPPAAETPAVSPVLLVVVVVLAAICVSETAYIVWSLIERRKGKPRIRRV